MLDALAHEHLQDAPPVAERTERALTVDARILLAGHLGHRELGLGSLEPSTKSGHEDAGGARLIAELFEHPRGIVYVDTFWPGATSIPLHAVAGEVVRESAHVYAKRGLLCEPVVQQLGG